MDLSLYFSRDLWPGKIDEALALVNDLDSEILDTNAELYLELQIAKLIEMIRQGEVDTALAFAQEELAPAGDSKKFTIPSRCIHPAYAKRTESPATARFHRREEPQEPERNRKRPGPARLSRRPQLPSSIPAAAIQSTAHRVQSEPSHSDCGMQGTQLAAGQAVQAAEMEPGKAAEIRGWCQTPSESTVVTSARSPSE